MSNHYLAFTIGPIFQTITRARKTRELWASSYVFSLLMRRILEELPRENILLPHVPQGSIPASDNGAGIWPDRCIVQITKGTLPDVKAIIDKACEKLAGDLKISKNTIQKLVKISPLKRIGKSLTLQTEQNPKMTGTLYPCTGFTGFWITWNWQRLINPKKARPSIKY